MASSPALPVGISIEHRRDRRRSVGDAPASSSNSTTLSISVPIAMLVTRSSMISMTTGTLCSAIHFSACAIAGSISSCRCTRIALQPNLGDRDSDRRRSR
jgi:hypothetical protein